jgi:hypothetical protein
MLQNYMIFSDLQAHIKFAEKNSEVDRQNYMKKSAFPCTCEMKKSFFTEEKIGAAAEVFPCRMNGGL